MNRDIKRSLKTLDALIRKQAWDILELRSGLAQTRELIGQLSHVIEVVDMAIVGIESSLRFPNDSCQIIAVDAVQRDRRFLLEKQMELARLLHERQRAEVLEHEFIKKLTELHLQRRVYENLSDRKRSVVAAYNERMDMRRLDEMSVRRRRG